MLEGQAGLTWARWQAILQAAEDFGFQCVFRSDHFTIGPPDEESLETWVSLTYAASHTQRIEFGTCVSPVTFRHPALLTRMAAAVLAAQPAELWLFDYHLDRGDTGVLLAGRLRGRYGAAPCLILSADAGEATRAAAQEAELALLPKPVRPLALKSVLDRMLAAARR
ncbi:MAG: LLM class flavin-dependent oxidoreductase [Xanthomonadales bacterium]|nr:LLM class flavin-dependent oxidoreductase [Xanthomonadales bacterium]